MDLLKLTEGNLRCVMKSRNVEDDELFDIRLSDEDIFDLEVDTKKRTRDVFLTLSKKHSTKQDILCHIQVNCQFLNCNDQDSIRISEQVYEIIKQ